MEGREARDENAARRHPLAATRASPASTPRVCMPASAPQCGVNRSLISTSICLDSQFKGVGTKLWSAWRPL